MILQGVLLVILGGLFGWILGKLPDKWVYVIIAITILLIILLLAKIITFDIFI